MRVFLVLLLLAVPLPTMAGGWMVSEPDTFGYRRALLDVDGARLAIVCPPDRGPFVVPVVDPRPDGKSNSRLVLGLEIDGVRHDQPMVCSEIICEADLTDVSWQALQSGAEVTIWFDDGRGPTFPLDGSAAALSTCSPDY